MQLFKKIAHLFMALLLVVATMGVTMHKHYCMGRVKDVAYFEKSKHCAEMIGMEQEDCPMSCCKDTEQEFKVDDLSVTAFAFDLDTDFHLLNAFTYLLLDFNVLTVPAHQVAYQNYKPPLIEQDIPVLVQSFLL